MWLRQFLLSMIVFFGSLGSLTVYAASSQQECCMRLFNGHFLPLECGNFLGGSVLSLPERMQRRMPPLMCGVVPPAMNRVPPMVGVPAMMGISPVMVMPMMGIPVMGIPPMFGYRYF
jgi:hypothetical protein